MAEQSERLNAKQARAVAAMLKAPNVRAASRESGIPESTLWRWLSMPVFVAALKSAEQDAVEAAVRMLASDMAANHGLMRIIRDDEYIPAAIRLKAAIALDNSHLQWRDKYDFERRLTEIERRLGNGE